MSGALFQGAVARRVGAYFVASGLGATGLTVTVSVWRYNAGSWSNIVTAASATAATEVGEGFYNYSIASGSVAAGDLFAVKFITTGTADQKQVSAWLEIESNWTATVAGRIDAAISTVAAGVWAVATSTLTVAGTIGKRIVDYLTGDIFARIGAPVGASISADVAAVKADTVLIYARQGAPAGASQSADVAAVKADTALIYARQGAPAGASQSADVAAVSAKLGTPAGVSIAADIANVPDNTEFNAAVAGLSVAIGTRAAPADLAPLALEATSQAIGVIASANAVKLGTPAGASISADVAAVKADTGGLRTDYTTGKAAFLDVAISTRATVAGVWDALLTSITTTGSIGKRIKDYLDAQVSTLPALITAALRAVVVTFRTPVESEGVISIRAGDDYTTGVYDRAFVWQLENLPELVGGTAALAVDGVLLVSDGTVTDGGVDGDGNTLQTVTVEVPAASSALLVAANWGQRKLFSVRVTQGGELLTEISGTASVYPPHPAA